MKKLLAILSSATLSVSTIATVIACGQTTKDKIDLSKFNNSLSNMQGSAASVAQQLILADQFKLSTETLQSSLGGLSAKDVVEKTTGLEYDSQDFNLDENSDLADLNEQYFGNLNLEETKIGENINLDGTIGLKNDQLWRFLKESLGVDLGGTSDTITAILNLLSGLNGFGLQDLLQKILPGLDLGDLLENAGLNKTILEAISIACRSLFKDEEFLSKLNIENFDIGTTFSEMKVEHITSAAMVSLSNAIGLFVNADYKTTEFTVADFEKDHSEVTKIVAKNLKKAGDHVGEVIAKALIPDKTSSDSQTLTKINPLFDFEKFNNELLDNIERYAKAIANLFQFLEFLQLQFSLFDDIKDYQPKDNQHLFNETQTNKEYLKDVLGSGKKLSEVTDVNDEGKVQGSLNLKYLLSIFKNAFSDLEHGYNLQRFLAILFLDFKEVDPDQWDDKMASPFSSWLTQVLDQVLLQFLKGFAEIPPTFEFTVRDFILKPVVLPFLTTILDSLLSGGSLQKAFQHLIPNIMEKLDLILTLDNIVHFLDPATRAILKQISDAQGFLTEILTNLLDLIPLVTAENSFKELYEGNPLDLEPLIEKLKEVQEQIGDLLPKDILTFIVTIISTLENFSNSSFLPDNKEINLKNLLTTPLNKINNQSIIPPAFGGYYLEKSIVEIVDDVCEKVHVNGHEILKGEGENVIPEVFNFKLSYLKDIFKMIAKYDYEGIPEEYKGKDINLISIILETLKDPEQFGKILGIVKEENGKISFGEGSLLYLIFHDILKVQDSGKEGNVDNDPFAFFITLLFSIFNNLNSPGLDYTEAFQNLFNNEKPFEFTYNPPVTDDGVLLGQIMVVKYHNFENSTNWTYTINYSREKVSDYFKIRLLKKEAV